jgi:hypothetical protein
VRARVYAETIRVDDRVRAGGRRAFACVVRAGVTCAEFPFVFREAVGLLTNHDSRVPIGRIGKEDDDDDDDDLIVCV